ncbi:hypothetical protein GCM10020367_37810 [Streptomyces sannanensis]|uniref:WXG100 family type VII secretion target n=2 Tax=Streptomyces sannanensis TaxID=285536 RepID=A0ABP6SDU5_9ACTN
MASDDLNIAAGELRASAGAADTLVTDLQAPLRKAIDDMAAASGSFRAWTVGPRLGSTGTGWGSALSTLQGRLGEHARGLRMLANGDDITNQEVSDSFKGW